MQIVVRVLNRSNAAEVFELRRSCYLTALDFRVADGDDCLNWSGEDDRAVVLGAFDPAGELIATMRGEVLSNLAGLGPQTALAMGMPPGLFPTLYLSRAATSPKHAYHGVNAHLRIRFLEDAIQNGLHSLSGVVTTHAIRARTLEELGYDSYGTTEEDEGLVARSGPWRLVVLDLEREGARALEILRGKCANGAPAKVSVSAQPRA